ncbi:thiamine pyrophosphate-dependent enzyme [Pseudofrankia sp. BMG5.36]|uniref:thiamine pyrophosphate-dependent enzyme n=1 Tax=Pseudofrankia sp. BMG5.36 TaxID=1834512 RepID=UPI0008D9D2A8|nr:thiamine pyrophosphate-dependent enzyme [Pseudofrankia sp. BMG5.36]OHV58669.1 pyruvate dehydrogenase [Pseudofrankia sp. BMG5.36]
MSSGDSSDDYGVRLLNPDGSACEHVDFLALLGVEGLKGCYGAMLRARHLDEAATALQRQGELVLWIPLRGQEAAQIGSVRAASPADFIFPSYREHAVAWDRGLPAVEVLRLLRGITHGGWDPAAHNLANYALVLASQTLHAVGYALGLQLDAQLGPRLDAQAGVPGGQEPAAVLVYLGDGAMSQGDANEAFVWAASFNAPVVFFCQNNQWAISTPAARQSRVPLAARAAGFGFPGVRVDGNDVVAVHSVTSSALARARVGEGPTLIEAYTYRMGPHTTSDDPTRYQPAGEVDHWRALDPIDRVERALAPVCDAAWFGEQRAEAEAAAARLRTETLALPDPPPDAFFDEVLVTETEEARAQRASFREYRESFQV